MKMSRVYAYIDEAANLADENQFLIIGVVSTRSGEEIKRILKRTRKNVLGKLKRQIPELKYSRVSKRVVSYVIKKLAQQDVAIYAWIVDKENRRVKDTPKNYGLVLGYVLKYGFNVAGWGKALIDEKYDKERDKLKLEQMLGKILGKDLFDKKRIIFAKSEKEPGIGLADFVAGAFYSAYNQKNYKFIELLQDKIAMKERIKWREIKQKTNAPRGSVAPV